MTISSGIAGTALSAVEAVLFDLDDTLVSSDAMWYAVDVVCRYTAAKHDIPVPAALATAYRHTFEAAWKGFSTMLAPLGSVHAIRRYPWTHALAAVGISATDAELDHLVNALLAHQLTITRPDPHLPGLLRALADRYPLAVVSNASAIHAEARLAKAGLLDLFDAVICGLDDQVLKPDPEAFARCCRELGVDPGSCLYIGDDWNNDMIGARQAGLHPIWVPRNPQPVPAGEPPTPLYPNINAAVRAILRAPAFPNPQQTAHPEEYDDHARPNDKRPGCRQGHGTAHLHRKPSACGRGAESTPGEPEV
ncbi:HAD family hydrolase [Micromonospora pisi]|uniref:HAD family hydrolase n=1 Tax=Micromonospora pisi TaxID=589240 RepID=UPI0014772DFF|nr:HAD family hydrolase [Micromonospora pisi]